jgi:GT2 family glycosyltransferase
MNVAVKEPVYIIIPVHNRKDTTLKCLEHLDKSGDLQSYHILVVDDGSTDGTTAAINSLYPNVTVLPGDGNLWWTGAIKKGMEYAYEQGAEYFVWLNDDCLVTEKAIPNLINFCCQSSLNIIGCQGYELDNPDRISFGGRYKHWYDYKLVKFPENEIHQCDLLSGNLVAFSKAVIEVIGFPKPELLPHYGGDAWYLIEARKSGFNIFVNTRYKVFDTNIIRKTAPNNWLITDGGTFDIFKLIFQKQSCLSWNRFFYILKAEYSFQGIFIFFISYGLFLVPKIILITLLRYIPIKNRKYIYNLKFKTKQLFSLNH